MKDGEMYPKICVEWTADHFGLVWHKSIHFWRQYARKKRRLHFRPQWPWLKNFDFIFAPL